MRIGVIHREDITWSIADVRDGLRDGLRALGHHVTADPEASVEWFIVVNPMFQTASQLAALRALAPVAALCTETPYDQDRELACAGLVDGGWTHERVSVPDFQRVNQRFGYLRHAWHPDRHTPGAPDPSVPAHDVVFVGSGFGERIAWVNAMDWTGIDLGLYGLWEGQGLSGHWEHCNKGGITSNVDAVALYRRATIGLNLFRTKSGRRWLQKSHEVMAESLSPRSYELAACGVFQISNDRAEVGEVFGEAVPRLHQVATDPALLAEDRATILAWLAPERAACRAACAEACRQAVQGDSWVDRARQVVSDLDRWSATA